MDLTIVYLTVPENGRERGREGMQRKRNRKEKREENVYLFH